MKKKTTVKKAKKSKPTYIPIVLPPDSPYMSTKEKAESDAAFLRAIGYRHVKIIETKKGYRVEASSKGE